MKDIAEKILTGITIAASTAGIGYCTIYGPNKNINEIKYVQVSPTRPIDVEQALWSFWDKDNNGKMDKATAEIIPAPGARPKNAYAIRLSFEGESAQHAFENLEGRCAQYDKERKEWAQARQEGRKTIDYSGLCD